MQNQAQITANALLTMRPNINESLEHFVMRVVQYQEFIAATLNVVAIPRNIISEESDTDSA